MSWKYIFAFFKINSIPHLLPQLFLIVILPIYLHLIINVKSLPVTSLQNNPDTFDGDEYQYQFDDIIPNPMDGNGRSRRKSKRWPKEGILMFYPVLDYTDREVCYLKTAVRIINTFSCIPIYIFHLSIQCSKEPDPLLCVVAPENAESGTFKAMVEAGAPTDYNDYDGYIVISNKLGCSSLVGRMGGRQEITLQSRCFDVGAGAAIHEMIHALGYRHEHTRIDRDEYVTINFTHVENGRQHNFNKSNPKLYTDFGPYNYLSIMHYGSYAFAKNMKSRTIIPKQKDYPLISMMGQAVYLTLGDKIKIRSVTHCPGETYEDHIIAIQNLPTQNFQSDTSVRALECLNFK